MHLPFGMDTPLGVLRIVQFFYIKHYPFPYQIPYRFVYRRGILYLEVVPLKRWYHKFIPLLVTLGTILLCILSVFYLAMDEDEILWYIRFWVWMCCIIVSISSTYANLIVVLDTGQVRVRLWEEMLEFDWHVRKGKSNYLRTYLSSYLYVYTKTNIEICQDSSEWYAQKIVWFIFSWIYSEQWH